MGTFGQSETLVFRLCKFKYWRRVSVARLYDEDGVTAMLATMWWNVQFIYDPFVARLVTSSR